MNLRCLVTVLQRRRVLRTLPKRPLLPLRFRRVRSPPPASCCVKPFASAPPGLAVAATRDATAEGQTRIVLPFHIGTAQTGLRDCGILSLHVPKLVASRNLEIVYLAAAREHGAWLKLGPWGLVLPVTLHPDSGPTCRRISCGNRWKVTSGPSMADAGKRPWAGQQVEGA